MEENEMSSKLLSLLVLDCLEDDYLIIKMYIKRCQIKKFDR